MIGKMNIKEQANSVSELFSYLKIGQLNDNIAWPTLIALNAFRFSDYLNNEPALDEAVEFLLEHWIIKKPIGPCHYGIGKLFMQVEYPFGNYNLFQYVYVLSFYDRAKDDYYVFYYKFLYWTVSILMEHLQFVTRDEFRSWLHDNCLSSGGVWLLFGKSGKPKTIKAGEALEEALCFGWIDGQIQSIDDKTYIKYFSMRRKNSKWSNKNKALVEQLEKQGQMTDYGRAKISEAKKNGQWDAPESLTVTEEQIAFLSDLLREHEPAYTNFQAMSPSVKKTYTRAYYDAKTDAGRVKRLSWMIERLNENLKPM